MVNRTDEKRPYHYGDGYNFGGGFALIVVLFILLIIVGAAWVY
ncbi:YjcZ family sporulation protein [Bacillus sp. SL00103]